MKTCARCGIEDGQFASIHEHHINGDHKDNRPENKMFLCANCHMTLHWRRWKLSDIGLPDVELPRKSMAVVEGLLEERKTFHYAGYAMIEKRAVNGGSSARVFVPKKWVGKRIAVVLVESLKGV